MPKSTLLAEAFESIKQQQQELVAIIFSQSTSESDLSKGYDKRGLAIYRNNLLATSRQALAITFPTLKHLIGEDVFNYACQQYLILSPPTQGDWGVWGEGFADLLKDLPQLAEYPFVADIATLDWLRHQSMRAKDSRLDVDSVKMLATTELNDLYLALSPSHFLMRSKYPVIEFWLAHQNSDKGSTADLKQDYLEQAEDNLSTINFEQRVLIYRPNYKAEVRELCMTDYHWLTQIGQGISIGKALDNLAGEDFDFAQWLGLAIEQNIICQFNK